MAGSHGDHVLRHLHHLLGGGGAPADDGRLLERFVARRDEDAFAELVARHGPLVYGVCRRVLRDAHDAEDVFQAAFLVLARKAAAIRKPESLSCYLHGVAYRLAIKARAEAGRRREHERQAPPQPHTEEADLSWREVRGLLDEELQRLPEKQRLPLVLCYLEGLTQDEAAQKLNWPRGTLKRRLERGRERLRVRLTRRGVTLGATLFAVALTASGIKGALPTALRTATVQASLLFTAGATAGIADTRAVLLAKGALQTMMMTKPKLAAMMILLLTCAATAAGLMSQPAAVEKTPEQKTNATPTPRDEPKQVRKDRHGDALPAAALLRLGTVRLRHASGISPVVFAADGKTAIVGEQEGDLVYWDVATGREVRRFPRAVPNWPCHLAITADGKTLAAADRVDTLFLFDVAEGKLLSGFQVPSIGHQFSIGQLLFAPDGRTLAIRGYKTILLWDVVHKKIRHELKGHIDHLRCLAFNPDGKTLASAAEGDPRIRLWDVAAGKEKLHIDFDKGGVWGLAFSPDGKTLAAVDSASWHLSFFDANNGKKLRASKDTFFGVSPILYAPDGKTLAALDYGTVRILDAASGRRLRSFEGPPRAMNGLAFSPDGKTLATFWSVLPAQSAHTFDLWDTASGKRLPSFAGHREGVSRVAFAADGKTLYSIARFSDGALLAWDAATGELRGRVGKQNQTYNGMALSPDGKLLAACGDREIHLWDAATRKKIRDCEGDDFFLIRWAAWSADNRTLVSSGHSDRTIRIWDAATGKRRGTIQTKLDNPPQATLSPDGAIVAAGGYPDGTIHLWSAATGKELRKMATPPKRLHGEFVRPGRELFYPMVNALAFHPDGSLLASNGWEGDIYLWDPATGQQLRHWESKAGWIQQLAFAPDGRTLVSGHRDSRVHLWEVATGRERACFTGHRREVLSVAFAPDGRHVASGSEDTTILIWDAMEGARPDVALSTKELQSLWADLIGTDAGRAYHAMWRMALAPKQSLPFLGEQLRRIARLDAEQQEKIARLIADLDSDQFTVREKATGELEMMVTWVEPALRKALAGRPSLEVRRRIEKVLEKVAGWSGERLRTMRALEAVEHMNAPDARRLLDDLANGTSRGWVTEEARKIRKRLDG